MLKLFDLLRAAGDDLDPAECKLHFVAPDRGGELALLDDVAKGRFDKDWQRHQKRKVFELPRIVALIPHRCAGSGEWLFAGCWDSLGSGRGSKEWPVLYRTKKRNQTRDLDARVVVLCKDGAKRQRYRYAEDLADDLIVSEILREQPLADKFPGYRSVDLSFSDLQTIIEKSPSDWRARLEAVGGVYVVTDSRKGKLYVGIAHGEGGIWSRWAQYADRAPDVKLLDAPFKTRPADFRFSILEIVDRDIATDDLRDRESHWKKILQTRERGYNEN